MLVDHEGEFRLDFGKRFQWTKNIFSEAEITIRQHERPEWELSLLFSPSWHWAVGAMLTENKLGGGVQVRF